MQQVSQISNADETLRFRSCQKDQPPTPNSTDKTTELITIDALRPGIQMPKPCAKSDSNAPASLPNKVTSVEYTVPPHWVKCPRASRPAIWMNSLSPTSSIQSPNQRELIVTNDNTARKNLRGCASKTIPGIKNGR